MSNRDNAYLPYPIVKQRYLEMSHLTIGEIETKIYRSIVKIEERFQDQQKRNPRKALSWFTSGIGKLPYVTYDWYPKKVIEYDMQDGEYHSHDEFWSDEDIVVTCPNCAYSEALPAYVAGERMVFWTALCSGVESIEENMETG